MGFAADLARFTARANGDIDQATRLATIMLAQSVVNVSPVLTGRFRANWNFAIGMASTATSESTDPTGQRTLSRMISQIGNTRAGGVTYLSNNLPYAESLERGTSSQAPAGVVRQTVANFQEYVSAAVAQTRRI